MELIAQTRTILGKKSKNLKKEVKIPAVIFGKGLDSQAISVDSVRFGKVYAQSGHTALVDLNVEGTSTKVLIKDVQLGPVSGQPIHASFHQVNLKEKITAEVPIEVIGEEENPLVKAGEAIVITLINEISVECLPSDIPQSFTVDVSKLTEVGDGIAVSALKYDKEKVELVGYDEENLDELIVKLDHAVQEEVEEEVVDEAAAIAGLEATEEKKAEDEDGEESSDKSAQKED